MDLEDIISDGSEDSERNIIGNWKKSVLVMYWQITLKMLPEVMWKTEFVTDGFGHLANTSKQSV